MSETDDTVRQTYSESRALDLWDESDDCDAELINRYSDGWEEVFKLATVAGVVVVAEITVRPSGDETPVGGLTSTRLREVKIGKALEDAQRWSDSADDHVRMEGVLSTRRDNVGRRRTRPSEHLLLVAELYRAAVARASKSPAKEVWHELARQGTQRAQGTVRNDVCEARARGLIAPVDSNAAVLDAEYAQPLLEAGARGLERSRWDMPPS